MTARNGPLSIQLADGLPSLPRPPAYPLLAGPIHLGFPGLSVFLKRGYPDRQITDHCEQVRGNQFSWLSSSDFHGHELSADADEDCLRPRRCRDARWGRRFLDSRRAGSPFSWWRDVDTSPDLSHADWFLEGGHRVADGVDRCPKPSRARSSCGNWRRGSEGRVSPAMSRRGRRPIRCPPSSVALFGRGEILVRKRKPW
jgi:hypothetical protein